MLQMVQNNYCYLMDFEDYTQFLESDPVALAYVAASKEHRLAQNTSFIPHPQILQHHDDLVYSQFTETISKRLINSHYPSSFRNHNPFCPLCLRFVDSAHNFTTCFISNERIYLIHQDCLKRDQSYVVRNIGQLIQSPISIEQINPQRHNKYELGLDSRTFYMQIAFTHPINDKNFVKINKKVTLVRDHFRIVFDQNEQDSYFPNMIVLPVSDYHMSVTLAEVGKKTNNLKFTKYVSFRYLKDKRVNLVCEDVTLEVELVHKNEEKAKMIELMNYKYRYSPECLPIVRLYALKIGIPQEFQESEEDCVIESSTNILQKILTESPSQSNAKSSPPSKKRHFCKSDSTSSHENQGQKINLQKLLDTNTLVQYVKNNNQSRLFQQYLSCCKPEEIELILANTRDKLCQLITHQYGNYMVQKLFTVCSPYQRYYILQTIQPSLNELARNKQGTHTIQAFLSHFTSNQEYSLVSIEIMRDFYSLCTHNNSTHFIQKIVKTFPLHYTIGYFHYIAQNLLAFALDKNAMCVIKQMMQMMRQFQELQGKQQEYDQALEVVRRQLIFNVTFNVDRLIMDSYGNYVIQFCYELFNLQRCSGITQRILSQFANYSIGKFSSSVLVKCISAYWTNKRVYESLKSLKSHQILEIFRNKDGNKVLLQMMERLQGLQLWDRLYGVLIQAEPTNYYHDRWGVCLGSRSGQVGTHLSGFPEGRKKPQKNKRY